MECTEVTSELVPPYLIPVLFAYDPEQKHHSNLWRRLRSNQHGAVMKSFDLGVQET
jgi:hypothetical protein